MIERPYDDVCNDEPWRAPLTADESAELKVLNDDIGGTALDPEKRERWKRLSERCLLYGDRTAEPQPFVGLEPRDRREGDDSQSVWFVSWGEEFQMPEYDPNRPKPSLWQSLKWRAQGWRWWWSDLVLEAAYRIRKAWRALRHG